MQNLVSELCKLLSFLTLFIILSFLVSDCCQEPQNMFIINVFQNNIISVLGHGSENLAREDRESVSIINKHQIM